jgi:hypothetical protein
VADLVRIVISPFGEALALSSRAGGTNFVVTNLDISGVFTSSSTPSGQWRLFVQDRRAASRSRQVRK